MKLFNKGKRTIGTSQGSFAPQGVVEFDKEEAERLLRLYQGEVVKASHASAPDAEVKLKARIAELEETIADLSSSVDVDLKKENKALKKELKDVLKASKELEKQLSEAVAVSNPESDGEGDEEGRKK